MISCSEATRRLWEYLDATVDSATRETVEEHLAACRRCCGELEFAEHLRRFLAASGYEELPHDVRLRLHQSLEELGP